MNDTAKDLKPVGDSGDASSDDHVSKAKIGAALACFVCSHTVREPVWINKQGLFCCDMCKSDGDEEEEEEEGLVRVTAIEKLIREAGLPNTCKNEGCEHKAVIDDLVEHEKQCDRRQIYCPICSPSKGLVMLELIEHLKEQHDFTPENPKWNRVNDGCAAKIFFVGNTCCVALLDRVGDWWFSYVVVSCSEAEAKRFRCEIRMSSEDGQVTHSTHCNVVDIDSWRDFFAPDPSEARCFVVPDATFTHYNGGFETLDETRVDKLGEPIEFIVPLSVFVTEKTILNGK